MKKNIYKLLLVAFVCFGFQMGYSYGQVEYTLFKDSCIWSVNTAKYMTCGDTVINGKDYIKVYHQYDNNTFFEFDMAKATYFCAIRNDIENKKVYGIYHKPAYVMHDLDYANQYLSDATSEFLLYDFSLQMGDTVTVASFEYETDKIVLLIAQRDSIMIVDYYDNHNHVSFTIRNADSIVTLLSEATTKRVLVNFSFNERDNIGTQMWMEGIGSSSGIFSHADYPESTGDITPRSLICYQNREEIEYRTPITVLDRDQDCYSKGGLVSIDENTELQTVVSVYPNPTENKFYIYLFGINEYSSYNGTIFNVMGQDLYHFTINSKVTEVDLNHLPQGVYFLRVTQQDKIIQTKKIVKE